MSHVGLKVHIWDKQTAVFVREGGGATSSYAVYYLYTVLNEFMKCPNLKPERGTYSAKIICAGTLDSSEKSEVNQA